MCPALNKLKHMFVFLVEITETEDYICSQLSDDKKGLR